MEQDLTIYRYKVEMEVLTAIRFPAFHGTTLRGMLGNALMRVSKDLINNLFAPKPPNNFSDAGKYATVPPPFVIVPPHSLCPQYEQGEAYEFEISLIGTANKYLNDLISALLEFENLKVGTSGKMKLTNLYNIHSDNTSHKIYKTIDAKGITLKNYALNSPKTEGFGLQFTTAVQFKNLDYNKITFSDIVKRLQERLKLIATLYCNAPYQREAVLPDGHGAIECLSASFKNVEVVHHSRRYGTNKIYHAAIGRVHFKGDISPFYPLLKIGELSHIGSGTSSGLGKYHLIL